MMPVSKSFADDVAFHYAVLNPGKTMPEQLRGLAEQLKQTFRGARASARFLCANSGAGTACLAPLPDRSPLRKGPAEKMLVSSISALGEMAPPKRNARMAEFPLELQEQLLKLIVKKNQQKREAKKQAEPRAEPKGARKGAEKAPPRRGDSRVTPVEQKVDTVDFQTEESAERKRIAKEKKVAASASCEPCKHKNGKPSAKADKAAAKMAKPIVEPPAKPAKRSRKGEDDLTRLVNEAAANINPDDLLKDLLGKKAA